MDITGIQPQKACEVDSHLEAESSEPSHDNTLNDIFHPHPYPTIIEFNLHAWTWDWRLQQWQWSSQPALSSGGENVLESCATPWSEHLGWSRIQCIVIVSRTCGQNIGRGLPPTLESSRLEWCQAILPAKSEPGTIYTKDGYVSITILLYSTLNTHLIGNVESPPPFKEQACSCELESVAMPGIEVEEKEIGVRSLQLHHRHLPTNPWCSQVFIRNLKKRSFTLTSDETGQTSGQRSRRLGTGGGGNWGSHLGGDLVSGGLDDGHLYLGISLHF